MLHVLRSDAASHRAEIDADVAFVFAKLSVLVSSGRFPFCITASRMQAAR